MSNNNLNCKPIFYFGVTILSIILFAGSIAVATTPQNQYAFAQDDDEKEEQEQPEEEEQQDESKEEEEEENESKEEESPEEEQIITNETIQETAQQIIQTELDKAGIITNESQQTQPVVNPPQEVITIQEQPVINDGMQFDATCNCTTPVKATTSSQQPIMQPINPQQVQTPNVIEQIPITTANILSSKSLGKVVDPAYTNYYTVSNLFDNVINDISFWSQAGNSGFSVQLDQTLDGYQVCSIELNSIHNPKNVPYLLDIGVSKNYTGIIDQANERIQFDNCVKNMDQILMIFNSGNLISDDFVSIGEIKLFGSKLGGATEQPPTIPPVGPYKNATKINISNSEAQIDIKNSTITLKFDKDAAQATNYNVITIPDANVVK